MRAVVVARFFGKRTSSFKPGVLVRDVMDHRLIDESNPSTRRLFQKMFKILEGPIIRRKISVIGSIITLIFQREGRRQMVVVPHLLDSQAFGSNLQIRRFHRLSYQKNIQHEAHK